MTKYKHSLRYILPLAITLLSACSGKKNTPEPEQPAVFTVNKAYKIPEGFDVQGHRIARGLAPENSIFAVSQALQLPGLHTLETDVCISRDKKVVLSHEPWMSSRICNHPNDDRVMPYEDEKIRLYDMTYEEITRYRCGARLNKEFSKQRLKSEPKPLLDSLITYTQSYCARHNLPLPRFNIEIKSNPEWDGFYTPAPEEFARLVLDVIDKHGIAEHVMIQSFDPRSLEAVHRINPGIATALLSGEQADWDTDRKKLSFVPAVYSPDYRAVNTALAEAVHASGARLIPYTVNDSIQIVQVIESGSDGIISDYPDVVLNILKLYKK